MLWKLRNKWLNCKWSVIWALAYGLGFDELIEQHIQREYLWFTP